MPGSVRPARPRRWSTAAREARTVSNRVSPMSGSYRGTRAMPESTTMRTPSMVSEVSAIEVASTTLRHPLGAGAIALSCTLASSAPNSGTTSTLASCTRSPSKFWVRRISAAPGRNASTEPASARNADTIASAICRSSGASGLRPR